MALTLDLYTLASLPIVQPVVMLPFMLEAPKKSGRKKTAAGTRSLTNFRLARDVQAAVDAWAAAAHMTRSEVLRLFVQWGLEKSPPNE